jgi:hypothetical protein
LPARPPPNLETGSSHFFNSFYHIRNYRSGTDWFKKGENTGLGRWGDEGKRRKGGRKETLKRGNGETRSGRIKNQVPKLNLQIKSKC